MQTTKNLTREEIISEAQELFRKIDDWFFNNDTTHFCPNYYEALEDSFKLKGYLTKTELEDLRTIFKTWVLN